MSTRPLSFYDHFPKQFELAFKGSFFVTKSAKFHLYILQTRLDFMQLMINAHKEPNDEKQEDKEHDKEFKEVYKGVAKRGEFIDITS